jgi:hypothetical protein
MGGSDPACAGDQRGNDRGTPVSVGASQFAVRLVGKNIGILYFGLEISADPASMLYAHIGGPQELDAMSELF